MNHMLPASDSQEFVDGQFVSQRVRQVVDAIREYDPHLNVQWVPPAARRPGQAAFRITYDKPGQKPEIVFHVRREEDMTTMVLQGIIASDQKVNKVNISQLEAAEQAAALVAKQKAQDAMDEAHDIAMFAVKSPKNDLTLPGGIRIKDGIPFNANLLKD